jgi:hypothetical protein
MIKDSLSKNEISKEKCKEVYNMSKREDYNHLLSELKSPNSKIVLTSVSDGLKL